MSGVTAKNDVRADRLDRTVTGDVPEAATGFRVSKAAGKSWKVQSYDDGGEIISSEWPIEVLKQKGLALIRQRWGGGRYLLIWQGMRSNKVHGTVGKSRVFELRGDEPAPPPPLAALGDSPEGRLLAAGQEGRVSMGDMVAMLGLLEDRAEAKHRRELERLQLQFQQQINQSQAFFSQVLRLHNEGRAPVAAGRGADDPVLEEIRRLSTRFDALEEELEDDEEEEGPSIRQMMQEGFGLLRDMQRKRDEEESVTSRSMTHDRRRKQQGPPDKSGKRKR